MSIGADYARPVTVNGYACKNCTDVDLAKKHIDPAHPQDGPYGIDKTDASGAKARDLNAPGATAAASVNTPAVLFGGRLSAPAPAPATNAKPTPGYQLDFSV